MPHVLVSPHAHVPTPSAGRCTSVPARSNPSVPIAATYPDHRSGAAHRRPSRAAAMDLTGRQRTPGGIGRVRAMVDQGTIQTVVWGTGNMGRAAIRAIDAHPGLALVGGDRQQPGEGRPRRRRPRRPGPHARGRRHGRRRRRAGQRPRRRRLHGVGRHPARRRARRRVPGPARRRRGRHPGDLPAVRPHRRAPPRSSIRSTAAAKEGGGSLFVSGIDPGWGNDILPALLSGGSSTVDQVRCQEIFDYSTYDQPDSVRYLVGMGQPMDYEPTMVAPDRPDHGLGRPGPAHRPGPRRRARRDPRDARTPGAGGDGRERDGHVRGGHPGRAALRGAGHRRRRAA